MVKTVLYVQAHNYGASHADSLEKNGYDVLWARNGNGARCYLEEIGGRVDAMVVDADVQDMSREELFQTLRSNAKPSSRLIVSAMTGTQPITPETRREYDIEKVFTWDIIALHYLMDRLWEGKPASTFAV